jgi:hypothetical protein
LILFALVQKPSLCFFILSGLLSNIRGRNQQIHLKLLFSTVYRIYIPPSLYSYWATIKVTQKADWPIEWNTLLGNIFMLQDVISLKPNVISAVYMGNGVLWSLVYEDVLSINSLLFYYYSCNNLSYLPILNRIVMYFAIWWQA